MIIVNGKVLRCHVPSYHRVRTLLVVKRILTEYNVSHIPSTGLRSAQAAQYMPLPLPNANPLRRRPMPHTVAVNVPFSASIRTAEATGTTNDTQSNAKIDTIMSLLFIRFPCEKIVIFRSFKHSSSMVFVRSIDEEQLRAELARAICCCGFTVNHS